MSDDVNIFASPGLVGQAAQDVAVDIHDALTRRGIIEPDLTDCALSDHGGFAAGPNVGEAVAVPPAQIFRTYANGLEFTFERRVVGPFGEGDVGTSVTCRGCGLRQPFDPGDFSAPLRQLTDWLAGGDVPEFPCPACGHTDGLNELDLDQPWCAAEFTIRIWNWSILRPEFERWLLDQGPGPAVTIANRI